MSWQAMGASPFPSTASCEVHRKYNTLRSALTHADCAYPPAAHQHTVHETYFAIRTRLLSRDLQNHCHPLSPASLQERSTTPQEQLSHLTPSALFTPTNRSTGGRATIAGHCYDVSPFLGSFLEENPSSDEDKADAKENDDAGAQCTVNRSIQLSLSSSSSSSASEEPTNFESGAKATNDSAHQTLMTGALSTALPGDKPSAQAVALLPLSPGSQSSQSQCSTDTLDDQVSILLEDSEGLFSGSMLHTRTSSGHSKLRQSEEGSQRIDINNDVRCQPPRSILQQFITRALVSPVDHHITRRADGDGDESRKGITTTRSSEVPLFANNSTLPRRKRDESVPRGEAVISDDMGAGVEPTVAPVESFLFSPYAQVVDLKISCPPVGGPPSTADEAASPLPTTQQGVKVFVTCMEGNSHVIPPQDGKGADRDVLIVGLSDGALMVVSHPTRKGALLTPVEHTTNILRGHSAAVTDVTWAMNSVEGSEFTPPPKTGSSSSSEHHLISVGLDAFAIVWNMQTMCKVRSVSTQYRPFVARYLPWNRNLFVVGLHSSPQVRLYNISTGLLVKKFAASGAPISALAVIHHVGSSATMRLDEFSCLLVAGDVEGTLSLLAFTEGEEGPHLKKLAVFSRLVSPTALSANSSLTTEHLGKDIIASASTSIAAVGPKLLQLMGPTPDRQVVDSSAAFTNSGRVVNAVVQRLRPSGQYVERKFGKSGQLKSVATILPYRLLVTVAAATESAVLPSGKGYGNDIWLIAICRKAVASRVGKIHEALRNVVTTGGSNIVAVASGGGVALPSAHDTFEFFPQFRVRLDLTALPRPVSTDPTPPRRSVASMLSSAASLNAMASTVRDDGEFLVVHQYLSGVVCGVPSLCCSASPTGGDDNSFALSFGFRQHFHSSDAKQKVVVVVVSPLTKIPRGGLFQDRDTNSMVGMPLSHVVCDECRVVSELDLPPRRDNGCDDGMMIALCWSNSRKRLYAASGIGALYFWSRHALISKDDKLWGRNESHEARSNHSMAAAPRPPEGDDDDRTTMVSDFDWRLHIQQSSMKPTRRDKSSSGDEDTGGDSLDGRSSLESEVGNDEEQNMTEPQGDNHLGGNT